MKTIGVIGAGSWGTALATVLAGKGCSVRIYDVDEQHLHRMESSRENTDYLPGVELGDNISFAYSNEEALKGADVVLFSAPAQHFRSAAEAAKQYITDDMLIVNVAKGIERGTHEQLLAAKGFYASLFNAQWEA